MDGPSGGQLFPQDLQVSKTASVTSQIGNQPFSYTVTVFNVAIIDFTRAIDLNPQDGTYYSKRGNARFANGNRDAACLDWTIAGNLGYYEDFDKIKSLCD